MLLKGEYRPGCFDICDVCGESNTFKYSSAIYIIWRTIYAIDSREQQRYDEIFDGYNILKIAEICRYCWYNHDDYYKPSVLWRHGKIFYSDFIPVLYSNRQSLKKLDDQELKIYINLHTNFDLLNPQIYKIRKWFELID